MKNKYFYIAGYHRVVYCHDEIGKTLILGGMCEFVNDAKTSRTRQSVKALDFEALRPKKVLLGSLDKYSFLQLCESTNSYCVTESPQRTDRYFKFAEVLPLSPSTNIYNSGRIW